VAPANAQIITVPPGGALHAETLGRRIERLNKLEYK
jgi:hypothetical protein